MRTVGSHSRELPIGDESRFFPILARILELGRGPPALMKWVQGQLEVLNVRPESLESARVAQILGKLARILARLLSHDERKATLLSRNSTDLLSPR